MPISGSPVRNGNQNWWAQRHVDVNDTKIYYDLIQGYSTNTMPDNAYCLTYISYTLRFGSCYYFQVQVIGRHILIFVKHTSYSKQYPTY
jgi:hypothetical protein